MSGEVIRAYYEAFNRGDRETMLSLLTEDVAHDINQGGRETGKEAFGRFLAHMDRCYRERLTDIVVMTSATAPMPPRSSWSTAPISRPMPACRPRPARPTSCRPEPSSPCGTAGSRASPPAITSPTGAPRSGPKVEHRPARAPDGGAPAGACCPISPVCGSPCSVPIPTSMTARPTTRSATCAPTRRRPTA